MIVPSSPIPATANGSQSGVLFMFQDPVVGVDPDLVVFGGKVRGPPLPGRGRRNSRLDHRARGGPGYSEGSGRVPLEMHGTLGGLHASEYLQQPERRVAGGANVRSCYLDELLDCVTVRLVDEEAKPLVPCLEFLGHLVKTLGQSSDGNTWTPDLEVMVIVRESVLAELLGTEQLVADLLGGLRVAAVSHTLDMCGDLCKVDISGRAEVDADHVDLALLAWQESVEEDELALLDVAQVGTDEALTDVFCHWALSN